MSKRSFSRHTKLAIAIASYAGCASLYAQDQGSTASKTEIAEEIVVTGTQLRNQKIIGQKRDADFIGDFLTADGTGKLPDFNLADAIRRAPGVNTIFDEDEGQFVALRGLNADFVHTTSAAIAQDDVPLDEIVVKGYRGSLAGSLRLKRDATGVVDGIVAEDIADFPDLNIGESLQRITGVTLNRSDNGEGNRISVRGLPSRFVRTTLNGITAASAGSDGSNAVRSFDFDIFASELFSRIDIFKTNSADMTEGGIAATVDLRTPRPFDYDGSKFVVSVSGQYAELGGADNEFDPRIALVASNTWGHFGAAASVAWSDTVSRGDIAQGFRYQTTGAAFLTNTLNGADRTAGTLDDLTQADIDAGGWLINGSPGTLADYQGIAANTLTDSLPRVGPNVLDRERLGITTSLQYRPSDTFEIVADILYATFDDIGYRATIDGLTGFSRRGVDPLSLSVNNGVVDAATLTNISQRTESVEDAFEADFTHVTIDSTWDFADQWSAFARFGYSNAKEDELRRTYLYRFFGTFNYDLTDVEYPRISGVGFDYLDPNDYQPGGFRFRPRAREDEEKSLQLDIENDIDAGALSSIKFGVRLSDKTVGQVRGEQRGEFGQASIPFSQIATSVNNVAGDFLPNAPAGTPRDFLIISPGAGAAILPDSLRPTIPGDPLSTWDIEEKSFAAYIRTDWDFEWGVIDMGARVVRSEQTSIGTQQVGAVLEPVAIDNNYTDVLPSINVRFDLSDDVVLRVAANKAITRPTLGQLTPGTSVNPTVLTARGGNPRLEPFRATQYDMSLEWYFAEESLLAATFFYKDMESFIENTTTQEVITGTNLQNDMGNNVSGSTFSVSRPANGDDGELLGLELTYQQPFGNTGFGALVNATFADSEGSFTVGGAPVRTRLAGQSDISYNVVGYYENDTFSARAALSFRDEYRLTFREGLTDNIDDRTQLDLAATYRINDNFLVSFDALNVTGEDSLRTFGPQRLSLTFLEQEPIYVLSVRYTMQ